MGRLSPADTCAILACNVCFVQGFAHDEYLDQSTDLLNFLTSGPAPVYVGFGSMPSEDAAAKTQVVLDALAQAGQRGVVATGAPRRGLRLRVRRTDLGLLLAALGLALVIWLVAINEENPLLTEDLQSRVPVTVLGLGDNLAVVEDLSDESVRLRLRAPRSSWEDLDPADFRATLDLTGLGPGENTVPVRVVSRDPQVTILDVQLPQLTVSLDPLATMRTTADAIHDRLERAGVKLLQHGQGSRHRLLRDFRAAPHAVLLGTRTFWEGVDLPGDELQCLLIARLPFAVPDDPLVAARSAEFEEPFYDYTVPDAVLRFRQGFGRLIRRTTDRGVVVILDSRVWRKEYGTAFVEALPECTVSRVPLRKLGVAVYDWIERKVGAR